MVILGLDLGTSMIRVGWFRKHGLDIIPNAMGLPATPTCVAFNNEERLIGEAALSQMARNPTQTITHIHFLLGRSYHDNEVQVWIRRCPYTISELKHRPWIEIASYMGERRLFSPESILAMVLEQVKRDAETYLKADVTGVVLIVPGKWHAPQRQAAEDAAAIAGLNVLRVLPAPVALSYAYRTIMFSSHKDEETVCVIDVGGGYVNMGVASVTPGSLKMQSTEMTSMLSDIHPFDVDEALLHSFSDDIRRSYRVNPLKTPKVSAKLRKASQQIKHALSSSDKSMIQLECLLEGVDVIELSMTRDRFLGLSAVYLRTITEMLDAVLERAQASVNAISTVILMGGASRISWVQQSVADYFGKKPRVLGNADEGNILGAAIYALNYSYPIPAMVENVFVVDIVPYNIGIQTAEGSMQTLIHGNSPYPVKNSALFTTFMDFQPQLDIQVFAGNDPIAARNVLVTTFTLHNLPKALRGQLQILVVFDVDENGRLSITASDQQSGWTSGVLQASFPLRLTQNDLDAIVADHNVFATHDKIREDQTRKENEFEESVISLRESLTSLPKEDAAMVGGMLELIEGWQTDAASDNAGDLWYDRSMSVMSIIKSFVISKSNSAL